MHIDGSDDEDCDEQKKSSGIGYIIVAAIILVCIGFFIGRIVYEIKQPKIRNDQIIKCVQSDQVKEY